MITRLSIAFEDLLGSLIAPQVMPYCLAHVSIVLQIKFGEMEFKDFFWKVHNNTKIQQQSDFEIQLTTEKVHNSSIRNHFQREILAAVHLLLITIVK